MASAFVMSTRPTPLPMASRAFSIFGIIPGAVLGGIVIGLVESFTTSYVSSSMADAFVFLILIVVLVLKPAGILGKNVGEKV